VNNELKRVFTEAVVAEVLRNNLPRWAEETHRSLTQDITWPRVVRQIDTNVSDHLPGTTIWLNTYETRSFEKLESIYQIPRCYIPEDRSVKRAF
jgi:hypothetical protein